MCILLLITLETPIPSFLSPPVCPPISAIIDRQSNIVMGAVEQLTSSILAPAQLNELLDIVDLLRHRVFVVLDGFELLEISWSTLLKWIH